MRKVKLILSIAGVAILGFMAYNLSNKDDGNSRLSSEALSDFAIADTASINELILTDTEGNEGVHLKREKGGKWEMDNGACVQQHLVQNMLATFKHIKVKSPVPFGSIETVNKKLTYHHTKGEIYKKEKITKKMNV